MADSKLTALTETTALADTDLLFVVKDPAGTPLDRKITGANLRAAHHRHSRYTGGNLTLNNTNWTTVPSITNDLVLNAATGDDVEVGLSARWGTENVIGQLDVHTVVGGTRTNSLGSGAAVDNTTVGVSAWRGDNVAINASIPVLISVGGSILYTLQAGDIDSGTVTLRLVYRTSSATNKTLSATAGVPFHWYVKNLGASGA